MTLKGLGHSPIVNLLTEYVNFTVFTKNPLLSSRVTSQSTNNTVHYSMSFSSSIGFCIVLKAFNPKSQHTYTLTLPVQDFDVKKVFVNHLIDKVKSPKVIKTDYYWLIIALLVLGIPVVYEIDFHLRSSNTLHTIHTVCANLETIFFRALLASNFALIVKYRCMIFFSEESLLK